MWWSDPGRRSALVGLLALGACGFVPVYGPGSSGSRLRGQVAITAPDTVEGYRLLQALQLRLGAAPAPRYDLTVTLTLTRQAAATTGDDSTIRYSLPGQSDYVLRDPAGVVLAQGRVTAFSSYAASGTTVATAAAEADARDRLALMLADQIITRLAILDLPQ